MPLNELEIKQIFTQETELPKIVTEKKQTAYEFIRQEASGESSARASRKITPFSQRALHIPRAAGLVLACLIVAGSTAFAAASLLSRRERLQAIEEDELEDLYHTVQTSGALTYQSSRAWTAAELKRYQELKALYDKNERFPDARLKILQEGESYSGEGVCLRPTPSGEEHILYLPDAGMTDEDILEIIEYDNMEIYALYAHRDRELLEKGNWESRMVAMTDEEVDFYCLAYQTPVSGSYRRGDSAYGESCLTESEEARFRALTTAYETENLFPEKDAPIIEQPEDHDGTGIAFCWHDSAFYLPERDLTDEEILEIIDFQKKAIYAGCRLNEELGTGYRTERPTRQNKDSAAPDVAAKPFADTYGKGSLQELGSAQIGDTVLFGSYEQDNRKENGAEEIEWYVLDRTPDTLTLLSVNILDVGCYFPDMKYTAWKDSALREWLNGTFYETAFTGEEQARIRLTETESGENAAKDHVYLLSYEELWGYFGLRAEEIADPASFTSTEEGERQNLKYYEILDPRIFASSTKYARAQGLWYWTPQTTAAFHEFHKDLDFSPAEGKSSWWLRTASGEKYPCARTVDASGSINTQQYMNSLEGIRPVVVIALEP